MPAMGFKSETNEEFNKCICVVCFHPFSLTSEETSSTSPSQEDVLKNLSQLLNVSETIYHSVELRSLPKKLLCSVCQGTVSDSAKTLKEIEKLKCDLDISKRWTVRRLLESYCNSEEGQYRSWLGAEHGYTEIQRIRKAYAQCWSPCQVKLARCPQQPSSTSVHPEADSIHSDSENHSVYEDNIQDRWSPLEEQEEGEIDSSNGSSSNYVTLEPRPLIKQELFEDEQHQLDSDEEVPVVSDPTYPQAQSTSKIQKTKHKRIKGTCEFCSRVFVTSYSLARHKYRKHSGIPRPQKRLPYRVELLGELNSARLEGTIDNDTADSLNTTDALDTADNEGARQSRKTPASSVNDLDEGMEAESGGPWSPLEVIEAVYNDFSNGSTNNLLMERIIKEEHFEDDPIDSTEETPAVSEQTPEAQGPSRVQKAKPTVCDICGEVFARPYCLVRHKYRKHSGLPKAQKRLPYRVELLDELNSASLGAVDNDSVDPPSSLGATGTIDKEKIEHSEKYPSSISVVSDLEEDVEAEDENQNNSETGQGLPLLTRASDGRFHCPNCDKSYCRKLQCQIHIRRHHQQSPPDSESDSYYEALEAELTQNLTRGRDNRFHCPKCVNSYQRKAALKKHIGRHHVRPRRGRRKDYKPSNKKSGIKATDQQKAPEKENQSADIQTIQSTVETSRPQRVRRFRQRSVSKSESTDDKDSESENDDPKDSNYASSSADSEEVSEPENDDPSDSSQNSSSSDNDSEVESHKLVKKLSLSIRKDGRFHCPKCVKSYLRKSALQKHIRRHHSEAIPALLKQKPRSVKCPKCPKIFANEVQLLRHEKTVAVKWFSCSECSLHFHLFSLLYKHRVKAHPVPKPSHGGSKPLVCNQCSKAFSSSSLLHVHMKSAHDLVKRSEDTAAAAGDADYVRTYRPKYPCFECDNMYSSLVKLKEHMEKDHRAAEFKCLKCSKAFTTKNLLDRHTRITKQRWLNCPECESHFVSSSELYIHRRNVHQSVQSAACTTGEEEQQQPVASFPCTQCTTVLESEASLQAHLKYHDSDKHQINLNNKKCKSCPKVFFSMFMYKMHVQKEHGGNFLVHCKICKRLFQNKTLMMEHSKKEHPDSHRKCETCGEVIFSKFQYKLHMGLHNGATDFPCQTCPERFQDAESLVQHKRKHWDRTQRSYGCKFCPVFFPCSEDLAKHVEDAHKLDPGTSSLEPSTRTCSYCSQDFAGQKALFTHVDSAHPEDRGDFECELCEEPFTKKSRYEAHVLLHPPGQKDFQCSVCSQRFLKVSSLLSHTNVHRPRPESYTCRICDTTFDSPLELSEHKRVAHGFRLRGRGAVWRVKEQTHPCPHCEKKFTTQVNLRKHMKYHTNASVTCGLCSKVFPNQFKLRTHMRWHRAGSPPSSSPVVEAPTLECKYSCEICSRKFVYLHFYELHMKRHANPEGTVSLSIDATFDDDKNLLSFYCKCCELTYTKEAYLNVEGQFQILCDHGNCTCKSVYSSFPEFMTHHNTVCTEKYWKTVDFKCPDCGKTYAGKYVLKLHIATVHPKKNTYQCDICGRGYDVETALNSHKRRSHKMQKEFTCDVCGKGFKWRGSLALHLTCHSEVRDCVCEICGKSFKAKYALNKHIRTLHSQKPADFPCPICGKLFKCKNYVHNHVYSTHEKRRAPKARKPRTMETVGSDYEYSD